MRVLRVVVGVLLGASGALMCAASWQRWAGACGLLDYDGAACARRQDHLYDFLAPASPWQPIGGAAVLAGWSLVMLALALMVLPWALTGRRPGGPTAVALVGAVLGTAIVGAATLRSGYSELAVAPSGHDLALYAWLILPLAVLIRLVFSARGWARATAVGLALASPLVAWFSYALGPFDARPWWEAISGLLTLGAGLCLLCAAVIRPSTRAEATGVAVSMAGHEAPVSTK